MLLTFFSWIRMKTSSSEASIRSASVMKYGEMYPRSNCMPSTTSSEVVMDLASSTVITPSLPTFSIASAMRSPMVASLLAEMVPICEISFLLLQGLLSFFSSSTTTSTALSIPRLMSIGFAPAVMFLTPSR